MNVRHKIGFIVQYFPLATKNASYKCGSNFDECHEVSWFFQATVTASDCLNSRHRGHCLHPAARDVGVESNSQSEKRRLWKTACTLQRASVDICDIPCGNMTCRQGYGQKNAVSGRTYDLLPLGGLIFVRATPGTEQNNEVFPSNSSTVLPAV